MVLTHTPAWHAYEAADERAWLDQWARTEFTSGCPWARPDYDVMADLTAALAATAGRP